MKPFVILSILTTAIVILIGACGSYFAKPECDCVRQDGTCCNTVPVPDLGGADAKR
jgi:hypothetical protein